MTPGARFFVVLLACGACSAGTTAVRIEPQAAVPLEPAEAGAAEEVGAYAESPAPAPSSPAAMPAPAGHALLWSVSTWQSHVRIGRLLPNQDYRLAVQFGTVAPEQGVIAVTPSPTVLRLLDALVDAREDDAPVVLRLHLLVDGAHFASGTSAKDLVLDLSAYRRWREAGSPAPGVVLGSARFDLRTAARPTDDARLALLVWKDGVPVDELAFRVCIGGAGPGCQGLHPIESGEMPDPVRPLLSQGSQPTAAIHILEWRTRGASSMVALFKEQGRKAVSWSLDVSAEQLRNHLGRTVGRAIGAAAAAETERGLRDGGWALFKLLFPWRDDAQKRAHATFADFVRRHRGDASPATLFVRVVTADGVTLDLPMGLLATKETPTQVPEPIGFSLMVEVPLPVQDYEETECPRTWRLLLPAPDGAYDDGGALLAASRHTGVTPSTLPWPAPSFEAMFDFDAFRTWLEATEAENPTLLVVLSHHGDNAIWFDKASRLTSLEMSRRFRRPSVAILDGCGTMEPGATEFARALNRSGASAIVATATSVGGDLGGEYLRCFIAHIKGAPDEGLPISAVHFAALQCLRSTPGESGAFGARALVFTLLGNGSVRVCKPEVQ